MSAGAGDVGIRARGALVAWLVASAAWWVSACAPQLGTTADEARGDAAAGFVRARPERPAACRDVEPGTELQAAIERAAPGSALCLRPGVHQGPIALDQALTLWGAPGAVIRSTGKGTTVRVRAAGSRLLGLGIDGSGSRHDIDDAALRISASDVLIEGVEITRAMFGVLVDQAQRVTLRGCRIAGLSDVVAGLRGDAIRLWETRESRIEDNLIEASRDVVVWYSPHNVLRGNRIVGGRYGVHFMYSGDNQVVDNAFVSNVVGIFAMYSRNLLIRGNRLVDASGAAGMGLGLKEAGNVTVQDNVFVHDSIGLYVDTSPLYIGDYNRIERNRFLLSGTAVTFHGPSRGNLFADNELRGNRAQVEVEGGGDARESQWRGNYFDDYAGYDLDGDARGDVPYALRSLSGLLTSRVPETTFLRGTPALGLVEILGTLVPLVTPRTLIVDQRPRMQRPGGRRAG